MKEFIDYLSSHEPEVTPCEFGDHWHCYHPHDTKAAMYSYREYLQFHVREFSGASHEDRESHTTR